MIERRLQQTNPTFKDRIKSAVSSYLRPSTVLVSGGKNGDGFAVSAPAMRKRELFLIYTHWLQRSFQQAPIRLGRLNTETGEYDNDVEHPLLMLLRRPNMIHDYMAITKPVVRDLAGWGNAYWWARTQGGMMSLWYLPADKVEPKVTTNANEKIQQLSHYVYNSANGMQEIPSEEMIHFRQGIDPTNFLKGISPVGELVVEAALDHKVGIWALKALMSPRGIVSARMDGSGATPPQAIMDEIADDIAGKTADGKEGDLVGVRAPIDYKEATVLSANLQGLKLLMRISEDRFAAALGVPALATGLGSGQDKPFYRSVQQLNRHGYETVIDYQRIFSSAIERYLLPKFDAAVEENPLLYQVSFDNSKVRAFREDARQKTTRINLRWRSDQLTLKQVLGLEGDKVPDDDSLNVYYTEWTARLAARAAQAQTGNEPTNE